VFDWLSGTSIFQDFILIFCFKYRDVTFPVLFTFLGIGNDATTRQHDTDTADHGQPPPPRTEYLVRISSHFDMLCKRNMRKDIGNLYGKRGSICKYKNTQK
jgi:hypothetical protein